MYKSPIDIICGQMETQIEGTIMRAVQNVGVNVDKEELLKALRYDRGQYDKGYADGKTDAMASIVRCKDCKHYDNSEGIQWCHLNSKFYKWGTDWHSFPENGFCSYGERKDNES